jgi:hypothetical protein
MYGIGGDQHSEAICFAREKRFQTGRTELTMSELRDIVKNVK